MRFGTPVAPSASRNKVAPTPSRPPTAARSAPARNNFLSKFKPSNNANTSTTQNAKKGTPAPRARTGRRFIDRTVGYGDLDDWSHLPEADRTRIRGHSKTLLRAFRMTKWFLQVLGRFPFKTKKLADGSYTFTLHYCSITYWLFFLTTIVILVIFILFTAGTATIYMDLHSDSHRHDRCGNTWGQTIISRDMPFIIFVWSQMVLTAAGSVYMIAHGGSFLEFYNVVNEAVMQLDVDPTQGMFYSELRGNLMFGALFVAVSGLYLAKKVDVFEEVSLFVVQAICQFFWKDMYLFGKDVKPFTAQAYEELLPKCQTECAGCYPYNPDLQKCKEHGCYNHLSHPTYEVEMVKWIGFAIIAYSLLGARALTRQFEFFCQVLVNLASTWNRRFLNYSSKDNAINMADPYKRRITDTYIMKDHYEIVRLYNVTEGNFSFILFVYYAATFFSLISQFYYMALLSTQVTCAAAVQRERDAAWKGKCFNSSTGFNYTDQARDLTESLSYIKDLCEQEPGAEFNLTKCNASAVISVGEKTFAAAFKLIESVCENQPLGINEMECQPDKSVAGLNNTEEVLNAGLVQTKAKELPVVSFEDACEINQKTIIRRASVATSVLLVVTLASLIITTNEADRASHQADVGFYRVRRRGYMSCRTRRERNVMHSLVFSFTGPKPFVITAAGYFPIRKKTIVVTISGAFIYFLIIMSFKPGMIAANVRCLHPKNYSYVVEYPKII